jgi:tRNA A-37 threonylcarbamoyl transferase component Bud32
MSNKRSDIIQVLNEAYKNIKNKRLKFAEIDESSLNPYIEYKSRKDLSKKKSPKKIKKASESPNLKINNNNENEEMPEQINDSLNIKNIKDEINPKYENKEIDDNLNMNLNINNELDNQLEDPISPIKNVNMNMNNNFDGLEENINISEIENKDDNIIIPEIKNNPLIESKESTDTIFSAHKHVKQVKNEDFKILKILGRGSYGKVCLVEYLPTHEIYAMKSLKKDLLIREEKIESTLLEKEILETINHPFIINLIFCFQTEERINFVMPFIPGGELFQHLKKLKHFGELKAKFYAAQIALAIQHLHDKGYIYRDLKPENILMDEKGYLRITDFGLAKKIKEGEKANSFCGTPEYLAPEIINGVGYDKNVDWWSFGILLYEMICGIPPFYLQDLNKMYFLIKNEKNIKFDKKFLVSKDARDVITKLLEKNVEDRLSSHFGIEELKNHPFFKSIDFDALLRKEIEAPFLPRINDKTDVQNFDEVFTNEKLEMSNIASRNLSLVKENQYKFNKFIN